MDKELAMAVAALPTTMLALGSMAGATAAITNGHKEHVRRAIIVSSALLVAGAVVTGSTKTVFATAIACTAVYGVMWPLWSATASQDDKTWT